MTTLCEMYDQPAGACRRFGIVVGVAGECPRYVDCRTPREVREPAKRCKHHLGEAPNLPHKGPCCIPQMCGKFGAPVPIPKRNCGPQFCRLFEEDLPCG
jgi:hypothetical protein